MSATVPTMPGALPFIGHGLQLLRDPLPLMRKANTLAPVVRLKGPGPDVYLVTDPDLLHRMLVTDTRDYAKGRITDGAAPQFGPSLLMDIHFDGLTLFEAHRRHRRALQPAFHPRRIAAQVPQVRELTHTHCRHWQAGQTLRLDQDLARLAYDVTARTFCAATDSMASALAALTASTTTGVYWRVALPRLGRLSGVPGTGSFKRAAARLRAAVTVAIDLHRADPRDRGDVLSALLSARYHDTGEAMSDEQIVNEITFYMFAAVHGIADVLPHVFLELSRHPDAEERLHAELDTVLSGRPVQAEDLPRLHYTRRLLTEVMRLHPTVWLLARRTLRTVRLGTTDFPAGTEIAYGAYAAHHHPGIHHDPLRFDPDRWLPERTRALHKVAQLTFGTGPRKCIGDQLATTHMLTALATIAQHWRLHTPPGHRHRPTPRLFLRPGTLPALITQRTPMRTTSAAPAQS